MEVLQERQGRLAKPGGPAGWPPLGSRPGSGLLRRFQALLVLQAPGFQHFDDRVEGAGVGQGLVFHHHGRAGMHPGGVLWGFRKEDELRESGAEAVIGKPEELLGLLG